MWCGFYNKKFFKKASKNSRTKNIISETPLKTEFPKKQNADDKKATELKDKSKWPNHVMWKPETEKIEKAWRVSQRTQTKTQV